ncbi:hypothetical protein IWX90DRAFT_10278 [Phyllosticta citrichinensis]|uniref:Uncharacterized protein n=1 Tax=Phyllosticta citrichinensis TaxID=1130410 RepID=A0ABR1Y6F5_9PEZI
MHMHTHMYALHACRQAAYTHRLTHPSRARKQAWRGFGLLACFASSALLLHACCWTQGWLAGGRAAAGEAGPQIALAHRAAVPADRCSRLMKGSLCGWADVVVGGCSRGFWRLRMIALGVKMALFGPMSSVVSQDCFVRDRERSGRNDDGVLS